MKEGKGERKIDSQIVHEELALNRWQRNLKEIPQFLSIASISNGVIAWLFGVTGPLLIVLQSAAQGNLSTTTTISWVFSIYFVGGILTTLLSIYYRQPIAVAFSIPGAVLVGTALAQHSFAEVIGAYLVTGALILILGLLGIVKKIMSILPMPIMMGMVSGVLLPFGLNIILSLVEEPLLNGVTLIVFIIISFFSNFAKRFPPLLGAIITSFLLLYFLNLVEFSILSFSWAVPQFFMPEFKLAALGEVVIPLAITVIAIQNAQGIGVLSSMGYPPPINAMTNWSGIGSIFNSFMGAHSACIAGPMTAIIAGKDTGPRAGRYAASVVMGGLWIIFGLLAPLAVTAVRSIPISLIYLLGGLAMIGVLVNSLQMSFSSTFKMGALFSFMITVSGISLFNIGSPFWGLVGGVLISLILERNDFKQMLEG